MTYLYDTLQLAFSDGRYWVLEHRCTSYPGTEENPAYFGSPIYENKDGKLEMRRAGGDRIKPVIFGHNFSDEQVGQMYESIKEFDDFNKKMMGEYYEGSDEALSFGKMVTN